MKRFLSFSVLILVTGCHKAEPDKKPVVAVTVQRASTQDVPLVVTGAATVFGRSEAKISSRVTAPIATMLVRIGDSVRKGQLMATLQNADLRAQTADAVANVSNAQANLQKTQTGTVPAELSQARADAVAKAAASTLAQRVLAKRKELLAQGAISGREEQVSEADAVKAKADSDAARARLTAIEQHTGAADIKIAQSQVAQAKAQQNLAAANLSFSELRSPLNGSVTDQTMFPGDLAKPDTPIFTVADLSSAVARAQVDADHATKVRVGQVCSFALRDTATVQGEERFGKVTVVSQAVDQARHTVEVWCEIANSDHALKSGLFGSVKVAIGMAPNAVLIPRTAIEFEEGTSAGKVYVVDIQNVAHVRKVAAAAVDDSRVRIISGLTAGETVITTGGYGLDDGTNVTPMGMRQ